MYKFRDKKYGLKALSEKRLKIAERQSLNDPYDLRPFVLTDPILREVVEETIDEHFTDTGLMCFSECWDSPVQWAHYAGNHTGLCLGFEVRDMSWLVKVDYKPDLLVLDRGQFLEELALIPGGPNVSDQDFIHATEHLPALAIANKMLMTKHIHWQYEREWRAFTPLRNKAGDHHYFLFDDMLVLKQIIVGANSKITRRRIAQAIGDRHNDVQIIKAQPALDEFKMVSDADWVG